MPVISVVPDYEAHITPRDLPENFHGNIVVGVHWEGHLSYTFPVVFPLPPTMPFGALVKDVIAPYYADHPNAAKIDWTKVEWVIDNVNKKPDFNASLADNGVRMKSLIRFTMPGVFEVD